MVFLPRRVQSLQNLLFNFLYLCNDCLQLSSADFVLLPCAVWKFRGTQGDAGVWFRRYLEPVAEAAGSFGYLAAYRRRPFCGVPGCGEEPERQQL